VGAEMNRALAAIGIVMFVLAQYALAQVSEASSYSQKTLMKNWALSRCLGQVYGDGKATEDANASASAYLEFGRQPIEAYEALSVVIGKYANKKYAGSLRSDFNTMKCIDLFHSKELDELSSKFSTPKAGKSSLK
jgi:hypothetical protein